MAKFIPLVITRNSEKYSKEHDFIFEKLMYVLPEIKLVDFGKKQTHFITSQYKTVPACSAVFWVFIIVVNLTIHLQFNSSPIEPS